MRPFNNISKVFTCTEILLEFRSGSHDEVRRQTACEYVGFLGTGSDLPRSSFWAINVSVGAPKFDPCNRMTNPQARGVLMS